MSTHDTLLFALLVGAIIIVAGLVITASLLLDKDQYGYRQRPDRDHTNNFNAPAKDEPPTERGDTTGTRNNGAPKSSAGEFQKRR